MVLLRQFHGIMSDILLMADGRANGTAFGNWTFSDGSWQRYVSDSAEADRKGPQAQVISRVEFDLPNRIDDVGMGSFKIVRCEDDVPPMYSTVDSSYSSR